MKNINVITVCGSGTVSSAMLAVKIKDEFARHGYNAEVTETSSIALPSIVNTKKYDLIAYVSEVSADYGVPKVNAVGLLTGLNADEVMDECLKAVESV
jgi:PTS system galactitol-specific IIB component